MVDDRLDRSIDRSIDRETMDGWMGDRWPRDV